MGFLSNTAVLPAWVSWTTGIIKPAQLLPDFKVRQYSLASSVTLLDTKTPTTPVPDCKPRGQPL